MAQHHFVDALKLFLDTADPEELDNLAVRLKPYRITSLQVQNSNGRPAARSIPVIVLDDGRATPAPTPSLQQHIESLHAMASTQATSTPKVASQSMQIPIPTPPADSYFDFNSLPWGGPASSSCSPVFGHVQLSMANMMLEDAQLGELHSHLSMAGGQGYYQDACSSTTFLDSPMATPSPTSEMGDNSRAMQIEHYQTVTPYPEISQRQQPHQQIPRIAPQPPSQNPQPEKPNRRRRPRRNTAASITQAIISNSLSSSPSSPTGTTTTSTPHNPAASAALVFTSCIRKDYLDFLKTNLPEWVQDGLWRRTSSFTNPRKPQCFMMMGGNPSPPSTSSSSTNYNFLENIYSCVSQLDTRIETDQVRKRVALVLLHTEYLESYQDWKTRQQGHHHHRHGRRQSSSGSSGTVKGGVGRGDMTLMIDNILEQTTPNWGELSGKRKLQLRALFHERKRYGKRWSVLREELGNAVLLVCSGGLANMVSNTKVTMAALKSISQTIRESEAIMEVFGILEPLAQALVKNDGSYREFAQQQMHGLGSGFGSGIGYRAEQMLQRFEAIEAVREGMVERGGTDGEDVE